MAYHLKLFSGFISDSSQFAKNKLTDKMPDQIKFEILKSVVNESYSIYCQRNNKTVQLRLMQPLNFVLLSHVQEHELNFNCIAMHLYLNKLNKFQLRCVLKIMSFTVSLSSRPQAHIVRNVHDRLIVCL